MTVAVPPGILVVISAPSGAGKLTLLNKVREVEHDLVSTISVTTRAPRKGEQDGKDYYFLTMETFERRLAAGEFAEHAEVHGNRYGTLREELDRCLATDHAVLVEVDVQGMRSLRGLYEHAVTIFLMPPSLEELEKRLRQRGTEQAADVALRLRNAHEEMAARKEYDYIIVNDDIERAAGDMVAILRAERCRAWRQN
jgi:guanylate kinase